MDARSVRWLRSFYSSENACQAGWYTHAKIKSGTGTGQCRLSLVLLHISSYFLL